MGNYFFQNATAELKPGNKLIIKRLRRLQLETVIEIFKDYVANHYPNETLNAEEFEDVFSPLLNNTTPFFKLF
jgi:hypothetical protein